VDQAPANGLLAAMKHCASLQIGTGWCPWSRVDKRTQPCNTVVPHVDVVVALEKCKGQEDDATTNDDDEHCPEELAEGIHGARGVRKLKPLSVRKRRERQDEN